MATVGIFVTSGVAQTPADSRTQPLSPPVTSTLALKTLAKSKGADFLGRIVLVEGRYGEHQPRAWRVQALDREVPGRVREFMVSGGGVDTDRVILSWKHSRTVPINLVSVHSQSAFVKSELAAKDAKVGFDRLDYQLIMPSESEEPVWIVSLLRAGGVRVGEVQIGAESGRVLRKAWPGPAAAPARTPTVSQAPQPKVRPRLAPTPAQSAPPEQASLQQPQPQPRRTPVLIDAASVKEAPGQILEATRQGIIKTSGNVRDFFKDALRERRE